jgi:hypothetical protein
MIHQPLEKQKLHILKLLHGLDGGVALYETGKIS